VILYARWLANPPVIYTVTFKSNGGVPANDQTREVVAGASVGAAMPIVSRNGYTFIVWTTAQNGTGSVFTASTPVTGNITVYAQWNVVIPPPPGTTYYTVTFTGNGGTPAEQTRSVARGSSVGASNMPVNVTRNGFTFIGWNTAQNGTGTAFTATTAVTGNIRVYAQWAEDVDIGEPEIPRGFITDHIPYIQGYPNNSVKPDTAITRAEVAMVFFRLLSDTGKSAPRASVFKDVSNGAWYTQAICYLASINILNGYPDGTFKPNQPVTRAEFATIASRFDQLAESVGNAFPDIENHWAKIYINSAAIKGWVDGYTDGTFKPQDKITRAEVVKIVNTMLDRKIELEDIPVGIRLFTDFEGHWAYTHIVEASNDHDYVRKSNGYEIWTLK